MKRIIALTAIILLFPALASAQSKEELKLYNKTIERPSVKAYEKFLKKYPQSQFAAALAYSRDSLIYSAVDKKNERKIEEFLSKYPASAMSEQASKDIALLRVSAVSPQEAADALTSQMGGGKALAAAFRHYGQDFVVGACISSEQSSKISFVLLKKDAEEWNKEKEIQRDVNTLIKPCKTLFTDSAQLVSVVSGQYLMLAYLNVDESGMPVEYVLNLFDYERDNLYSEIFYGRSISNKGDRDYCIEGQSTAELSMGMVTAEQMYLTEVMKNNPGLVQIAKKDALTDEAISWWLSKNPKAQSSATSLQFGSLDEQSSIVELFMKQNKENSAKFTAALFDIRGYTVVCAYSKTHNQYVLVWCEKQARNKNTDRLLNTVYFENDNTLCLYYYEGRKTFKYRVNLASKAIKR